MYARLPMYQHYAMHVCLCLSCPYTACTCVSICIRYIHTLACYTLIHVTLSSYMYILCCYYIYHETYMILSISEILFAYINTHHYIICFIVYTYTQYIVFTLCYVYALPMIYYHVYACTYIPYLYTLVCMCSPLARIHNTMYVS